MDYVLVCLEFRGVFASWTTLAWASPSRAVCARGLRLWVALTRALCRVGHALRAAWRNGFSFFQGISKCFSNLVLS
jgi:hypothetical protein